MNYTINITQEDIDNSRPGCSHCPVALAVNRATGKVYYVCAPDGYDRIVKGVASMRPHDAYEKIYYLPPEATEFVNAFDKDQPVKPFSFTVGIWR